ncbi:hypothetical protein [Mesorhizobium sp. M7D.F.Ca.US.004.03.1.1]|uniref:hypothetical protein n=1 Tax=Mesorhizobium sp. M7D.F.Ca.US.004.03.1.1 TaxID=2496702 RepID=UPI000FC9F3B8|nr:hypothetical protein [Mesorhizobium sp. M7D.F.Ca.US.004.03.1.1]
MYLPAATADFAQKYEFVEFPKTLEEMRKAKVEFRHGRFNNISIESVDLYNDGVVITSRASSNVLDEFLIDVLAYMSERWHATFTKAFPIDRMYESTLTFHSDKDVLKLLAALNNISRSISNRLNATTGAAIDYYPFGIGLSADHAKIPSLKPIPFRIERREGVDFGANIYFSAAPLKTDDHIEILNEWERSV